MVADGFQAVIAAVEGTFSCMGVACSDLNTMYGSADRVPHGTPLDTACPHWNACADGASLPRDASAVTPTCDEEPEEPAEPDKTSGASLTDAALTAGTAAFLALIA